MRIKMITLLILFIISLHILYTARSGLSTSELEDVLACDDEALQNVYTRRPPPIRRLPPLYLVRLKSDLQQYLGKVSSI